MTDIILKAVKRTVLGKRNQSLRNLGKMPAVLYGKGKEGVNLEIDTKEFSRIYKEVGESTLIDLEVDDQKPVKVLIHDVASHYMKNEPIHVDFYEVDLTKKIKTNVALHFIGEAPAVKELAGVLVKSLNEVEVEALPTNLPHMIDVDISSLVAFNDAIRIKDLISSGDYEIVGHEEDLVIMVQPPRKQEDIEDLEKSTVEAEAAAVEGVAGEAGKEGGGKGDDESTLAKKEETA